MNSLPNIPQRVLKRIRPFYERLRSCAPRTLVAGVVFVFGVDLVSGQSSGLLQTGSMTIDFSSGGPVYVSATTNHYDVHGNLVQAVSRTSYAPDAQQITTWTYDKRGQIETAETVWQLQGVTTSRWLTNYSNLGFHQRLAVTTTDFDDDGNTNQPETAITTYNREGSPVLQSEEFDDDVDGTVDRRFISGWSYDYGQHQMIYTQEQDLNADGTADAHTRLVYILDNDGRPVSWDGYIANIRRPTGHVFSRGTNSYDKFGNLLETKSVLASNGPSGTSQLFSTTIYFYAHRGEVIRAANRGQPF